MTAPSHAQLVRSQTTPITIDAVDSTVSPYPSTITITGATGVVQRATVTLNRLSHTYPDDLDILLVATNGSGTPISVLLTSDAGGAFPVNGVDLTFADAAATALPDNTQIVGGSYRPSNFEAGADTFASPAPASGYVATLSSLDGLSPNGNWRLFVADDEAGGDGGSLSGWTLNLWTSSIITATNVNNNSVTMNEDGTLNLGIRVQNSGTSPVTVTATSTDPDLSGSGRLTLSSASGTGDFVTTLTIRPAANTSGVDQPVTIRVNNGVADSTLTLLVTVTPVNDPATLTLNTNRVTIPQGGWATNVVATVADVDTTASDTNLVAINVISSNPSIVTGISTTNAGTARPIIIVPTGAATGTATLTVEVIDRSVSGSFLTNSATIDVTVSPVTHAVFGNSANIAAVDGASTSSVSSVTVSNVPGLIGKLTVSLNGITGTEPDDLNVVLVGPGGERVVLMAETGGATDVNGIRLVFDDAATTALTTAALQSSTNDPTSLAATPTAPALGSPAPAAPYSQALSVFNNTNPNGEWRIYAFDNEDNDSSNSITGGFVLNIFPAPSVANIGPRSFAEDSTLTFTTTVTDLDGTISSVTLQSDNTSLASGTAAKTSTNGNVVTVTVTITNVLNQVGSTDFRLIATDNSGFTGTNTFAVTVTPVNDSPEISVIQKQDTTAGVPVGPIPFTISDVETLDASLLTVTASSDNETLLPNSNIVLGGSGANRTVTLYPAGTRSGTAFVTIRVSDGSATSTQTFRLDVFPAGNPLFNNATAITVNDGANATPYPSTISVSGLVGLVAEVKVTLSGITHPSPQDLDVLLVGPGTTPRKVVLMSDAGGSSAVANIQLILADSASGPIPDPLVSGTFDPTDLASGPADAWTGAPAGALDANLAAFNGTNPNGDWRLYVVDDDTTQRGGIISGGWTLSIRTAPQIAAIPTQVTDEDVARRVNIVIGDAQPGVELTVTATANGSPTANLVSSIDITGTGASRSLLITPVTNAFGTNTITVTVSDGVNSDTENFLFIVNPLDDAPTISEIADQSTPAATQIGPINFTVGDTETAATALQVTVAAADPSLIDTMTLSGSGANRSLTILPAGVRTGSTVITITVTDGTGQKATEAFTLNVVRNLAYANASPITINDAAPGSPFPSVINVSDVQGKVSKATVVLVGFTHAFPDDVDIVLVAPDGKKSALMMDAGNGSAVSNLRLTFTPTATTTIPNESALSSGTYLPANHTDAVEGNESTLGSGSPAGPYTADMANFLNAEPNGNWSLYVRDDTFPDGGSISGGWMLLLETGPTISAVATQTGTEDTPLVVPFTVLDSDSDPTNVTVTATVTVNSGQTNNLIASTVLTTNGNNRTITINPSTNMWGTNSITLNVTDGTTAASTSFSVIFRPVDDAPTLATATNRVITAEDTVINVAYTFRDVDSSVGFSTNVVVTSLDGLLVSNNASGIVVTGDNNVQAGVTGNFSIALRPALNQSGTNTIQVTVTDRNTITTNLLTLVITPVNDLPTMTTISEKTVVAGSSTTNISFTIGDVETPARNLTVTATSSDQNLVPNANIVLGGAAESRTIQVTTIGVVGGTAEISVVVNDGTDSITNKFNVVLTAAGQVFANTSAITIRDANSAQPYPSVINVSGLDGRINSVRVTVDGLSHTAPDDVDMLLVSPTGRKIMLLSDTGGRTPVSNVRLSFSATGASLGDDAPLSSGVYAPSDFEPGDSMLAPAPVGPYGDRLTTLQGDNPNGAWSLYIMDDSANDAGQIAFGWSLLVDTAPTIVLTSPSQPVTWNEDTTTTLTFAIDDDVTTSLNSLLLTFSSSNPALLPTNNIAVTRSGGTVTAVLTPVADANGTNLLTATIRRASDGVSSSIVVTNIVTPVNDLPTISRLTSKATTEDQPITFEVIVSDVDTVGTNLTVEGFSSAQSVISNTNILFNGTTNRLVGFTNGLLSVTLRPNTNATGISTIRIVVTDRGAAGNPTVEGEFFFSVQDTNDAPTISTIPNITLFAGATSTNIAFTVGDPEGGNLTITATSSDPSVVANSAIVIDQPSGPPGARTIRVTTQGGIQVQGTTTITVTVTDNGVPTSSASTSFVVTNRPTRERVFTSTRPIEIRDNGIADPYPSQISVNNLVGNVTKVTVSINGLTHRFPDDVDMMLVGPVGQKVLLMSDAGGGVAVSGINLVFDNSAAAPVGDNSLTAGTFRPANYESNPDVFPTPAPAGPYTSTSLTDFNGAAPNGIWSLYIVDDTPSDAGSITNGWSLNITTEPVIVGLANQTVDEDTAARQSFTVVEESFASTNFTFTVSSTNTALMPNGSIVVSGSGTNFTVTATPTTNSSGTNRITITLTNPDGQSVSSSYTVVVSPANDNPVISPMIGDQTIVAGTVKTGIAFNYSDVETDKKDLTLTVTSSNPELIPVGNITVVGNELQIVPQGNLTGQSTISLTVSDPQGGSASNTFLVTVVEPANPLFASTNLITIRDNNTADPYPSVINVSNLLGNVAKVTVTLAGFNHRFPDDVDVLLVGPGGQKVVLMSDAGGGTSVTNGRITFDDGATLTVPDNTAISPVAAYKPRNYEGIETFPAPVPTAGSYTDVLSTFNGTNPNGAWSLFVLDDQSPDAGTIVNGWLLSIVTTAPTLSVIPNQTLTEDVSAVVSFTVGDGDTAISNLVVTATSANTNLLNVIVGGAATNPVRTITLNPALNQSGTTTVDVSVSDGSTTNTSSFQVTIVPVNDAPTITGLVNTNTPANVRLRVPFTVTDDDFTGTNSVVVTATSDNTGVLTVSLDGSVLVLNPVAASSNAVTVTVVATDGSLSTTNQISVLVTAPIGPTISTIGNLTVNEDATNVTVSFTTTGGPNLTLRASTNTNPALVSAVNINPTTGVATLTLVPNASGTSDITITATDDFGSASSRFTITVVPVNDAPTLGAISNVTINSNTNATFRLTVADVETPIASLNFSATTATTPSTIVSNVTFAVVGGEVFATVNPRTNASGSEQVTIIVSDGSISASNTFTLTVTNAPTGAAATLSIARSGANVNLTINGTAGATYTVEGTSNFTSWSAVTNVQLSAGGTATVTLPATNPYTFFRTR